MIKTNEYLKEYWLVILFMLALVGILVYLGTHPPIFFKEKFDPNEHVVTKTCWDIMVEYDYPFDLTIIPHFERCETNESGLVWDSRKPYEWRSKTECEKGNPEYKEIPGCPFYECSCHMPLKPELCDEVMEICKKQAMKLPKEKMCIPKTKCELDPTAEGCVCDEYAGKTIRPFRECLLYGDTTYYNKVYNYTYQKHVVYGDSCCAWENETSHCALYNIKEYADGEYLDVAIGMEDYIIYEEEALIAKICIRAHEE